MEGARSSLSSGSASRPDRLRSLWWRRRPYVGVTVATARRRGQGLQEKHGEKKEAEGGEGEGFVLDALDEGQNIVPPHASDGSGSDGSSSTPLWVRFREKHSNGYRGYQSAISPAIQCSRIICLGISPSKIIRLGGWSESWVGPIRGS